MRRTLVLLIKASDKYEKSTRFECHKSRGTHLNCESASNKMKRMHLRRRFHVSDIGFRSHG
jgi:hypothetical protein